MFLNQLVHLYNLMTEHPMLKNVQQQFGQVYLGRQISSYPHIIWVPSRDLFTYDPVSQSQSFVYSQSEKQPNKEKHLFAFMTRKAGCELHMYHKDHSNMESLIIQVANALYDNLKSLQNFYINAGSWDNRTQISENTVKYVLDFSFDAPVYRLIDLGTAETIQIQETVILP